ncbi:MAG: hypothetical protein FJ214_07620 [Ignavibacteria bacterium]|nr:hypothetical protein [Ignavibacteria bacterium]
MKKLLLLLGVVLLTSAVAYAQVQVQSGTYFYSKDQNKDNYTLHSNQGKRMVEYEINFPKPFDKKPKVVVMPSLLDAEKSTQVRYSIRATGVSRDGFVLLAEVWGDTQLNAIGGFWLAHTEE